VIMTSNLGSQWITASDETDESMEEKVLATVRDHFKPEFLNRVDEIVVFHRLNTSDLAAIVDIQLEGLRGRLMQRSIGIEVTDEAKSFLTREGYEPAYGARPLKRLIQREIENRLALKLLDGTFKDGDTIVVVTGADGLEFRSAGSPAAV
jgi:ATP-dependent Clp protease ATP-binding subunit ClpB